MDENARGQSPVVHVVDDDPGVLESISWLLRSLDIPFKTYVGASDFLRDYVPERGGCLVLDVRMPGMGGLELQEHLNSAAVDIPIVFISGHGDVPMAVQAMKFGAVEFLQKPFDQRSLLDAIDRAFALDRRRRQAADHESDVATRLDSLSQREREALRLLLDGLSAKEIGKKLSISPRTVEFHRNNILTKMNARCLVSLAASLGSHLESISAPGK